MKAAAPILRQIDSTLRHIAYILRLIADILRQMSRLVVAAAASENCRDTSLDATCGCGMSNHLYFETNHIYFETSARGMFELPQCQRFYLLPRLFALIPSVCDAFDCGRARFHIKISTYVVIECKTL